ncbi:MAG TPA: primosomal protein N' [Pseudomonadales bacterium]|nr:primosomal protein N' [Pseudomonadales bacterium]
MKPVYLDIAVPVPLRQSFHYLPPEDTDASQLLPGIRVEVPFGRQILIGILLATSTRASFDPGKIKNAIRIIDSSPVFDDALFSLCRWAADYYQHPIGDVLHTALPILLRQGEATSQITERLMPTETGERPESIDSLTRAPRQLSLLKQLVASAHGDADKGLTRFALKRTLIPGSVTNGLIDKGFAQWSRTVEEISPFDKTFHKNSYKKSIFKEDPLVLTEEQSLAFQNVVRPGTHLLFGITGSGKTEIYLQAIARVLAQGKQALVLVPEIGLTPQTIRRFESRFRTPVVALHSGLTDRERLHAWRQAKQGGAAIVIGTRSAVFTQLHDLGLIVVDEEHDPSFKQQEGFRYSARDISVLRGKMQAVPVILGSATPSLESYNNAISARYQLVTLLSRPNKAKTAQYHLIGTQHETLDDGFSSALVHLIQQHLAQENQVLVFLNRRGFSPVLLCRACGWIAECNRCDARMTYHLALHSLICHHCGVRSRVTQNCADCSSDQLVPLGLGTQRLEHSLKNLFPDQKIVRIDRDSTRKKGAMEQITNDINQGEPAILVGTQLLAKGHHFPNVTLVAIVDIDSGFYSSDYRAIERMGQLLLQVAGRAGRESKPGTVAIQTRFPDQPILQTLINDGYKTFAENLLAERSRYDLPPFSYQAVVRAEATKAGLAMAFLSLLSKNTPASPSVSTLGPIPSSMEKRAGKHRAQLLFASKDRRSLQASLARCVTFAEDSAAARKVRWSIDVDPVDLF